MTVIITKNKKRMGLIVHSCKAFDAFRRGGRNICEIPVKLNGVPLYLGSHNRHLPWVVSMVVLCSDGLHL